MGQSSGALVQPVSGGPPTLGLPPLHDPSVWDTLHLKAAKNLKAPGAEFPRLSGSHGSGEAWGFRDWASMVETHLTGLGLVEVLTIAPPAATQSQEVLTWYRAASSIVAAALVTACRGIPILGDLAISMLRAKTDDGVSRAGLAVWLAIHQHFIRDVATNRQTLLTELAAFGPKPKETMDAFLLRADQLRLRFQSYNIELPDRELIVRVFLGLGYAWRRMTLQDLPRGVTVVEDASWADVHASLRRQDTERRQSYQEGETAFLPLGFEAKGKGRPAQPSAAPAQGSSSRPGSPRQGSPGKGRPGSKGPKDGKKKTGPQQPQSDRPLVCWVPECQQPGHYWIDCPKLAEARRKPGRGKDWRPRASTHGRAALAAHEAAQAHVAQGGRPEDAAQAQTLAASAASDQPRADRPVHAPRAVRLQVLQERPPPESPPARPFPPPAGGGGGARAVL